MTPTIRFERAPADVTIGEALVIATRYWTATVERWLLAVIAVALVEGLVSWLFVGPLQQQTDLQELMRMATRGEAIDPSLVPSLLAGPIAVGIVTLVAGWFLTANAVAGLRGTEVTLRWVLPAGLRALLTALLVGLTAALVATAAALLGPVGLFLLIGALPLGVYVLIRLAFWEISIFDGASIAEGLDRSWRITRRAVLRYVGWTLVLLAFTIGLFLLEAVVSATLAPIAAPVAAAVNGAIDLAFSAYTTIVVAMLYESQRARRLPVAPRAAVARSPFDPPPPPGF